MLEDDYTYVIRKALRGHGLTPADAAQKAGLSESEVLAFADGEFSAETARRLATVLGLKPDALAHHPDYLPQPLKLPNIHRLDFPFDGERVNAWLIWTDDAAILFDTGYESNACAAALIKLRVPRVDEVFITHAHRDHVGGISTLRGQGYRIHGDHIENARPMKPGEAIRCGSLTVRACDLSGHANPALGYHIDGLAQPVLVTGDALFAGSMGGCTTPAIYQHALQTLGKVLTPLPDSTVILPGHGPATTLGEERVHNPFLSPSPE